MADDPYVYPGTEVLRNRFGTRDAGELRLAEYAATERQSARAPTFPMTADGYRALHRHLFSEVYDWAGELRTINFSKGGTGFAPVRFLDSSLETVFRDLAARNTLRGLPAERFAEQAAHHLSELNVVHPFREGNGRAMRSHLEQLAAQAGHPLDVTRIPGSAWIEASIQGSAGDERPMARVIADTLAPARVLTAEAAAAEFAAALEPARQEIMAHARALRERAGKPGADARRLADEVSSLRAEMDRLRDPAGALTMLEVVRDAGGRIGVLARLDEPARERAHAILEAAARGPVGDVAPAPGLDAGRTDAHERKHPASKVLDALRPAQPDTPAPWDRELTPLGERLAAYTRRQEDQRAAEAAPAPPAKPAPDPDDTPQPRRRPGRDPGPGF